MKSATLGIAIVAVTASLSAGAAELPVPAHQVLNGPESVALAARTYAAFWDSGDPAYARAALSESFVDRTLPPGRPQGPEGPLVASAAFRTAVPDLHAEIDELIVSDDRAVLRLHFTGHFNGAFGAVKGEGQTVDFRAIDIYRVENGRIVEDWHIEDNLTFLSQIGAVSPR